MLEITDESGTNIWVYDIERGTLGKRTFGGENSFPIWTPDGEEILYTEGSGLDYLVRLRADGSSLGERLMMNGLTTGLEVATSWSDLHRVLLFQAGDPSMKFSTDGGAQAMWGPGGGELFYKSGDRMMVVSVSTDETFEPSSPRVLFETTLPERSPRDPSRYGVSADHQRFLITAPAPNADEAAGPEIHVIVNWFLELERLTPEGR